MALMTGIQVIPTPGPSPIPGEMYFDQNTHLMKLWDGNSWIAVTNSHYYESKRIIPTEYELEKHPALKNAWEQYLITRKLLGL